MAITRAQQARQMLKKGTKPVEQAGVMNYMPSEMVTVPKVAKSSPTHPTAKLAYITDAEKKLLIKKNLHGSLKGKPNRGPGGIPSLQGDFGGPGGFGGFQGGGDYSSAESGDFGGFDGTGSGGSPELPPGVDRKPSQTAQDIRSGFIAAGGGQRVNPGFFDSRNTVSPAELAAAKTFAPQAYKKTRGGGIMDFISGGGLLGGVVRGLGQAFGLGKKYNEPTYDMSGYNSLGLGGTGQEGFGVPTLQGDYDVLGNKINEITGEITSPTGQSLGFLDGYPGGPGSNDGGITTIPVGGSDEYVRLIEKFVPPSTMPEDEDLIGGFFSRYLPDDTPEEKAKKKEIEKMINEKFKYDYNSFGLGDMDGS